MTITNLKTLNNTIDKARTHKEQYKNLIQDAIVYFVNNYNTNLTFSTTPFKAILETVGKDGVDLLHWLKTYTNLLSVKADLLHFTTDEFTTIQDKDGNTKKLYVLKFKDTFDGQKWYETSVETDKKAIKALTDESLLKTLKALIKKLEDTDNNQVTVDTKGLLESAKKLTVKLCK